jgi:hypothetical protein
MTQGMFEPLKILSEDETSEQIGCCCPRKIGQVRLSGWHG